MKTKFDLATEQLNPTLRPCPFCGGQPYVAHYTGGYKNQEHGSYIKCGECGARSEKYTHIKYQLFVSECMMGDTSAILAANAWNRKPEDIRTFGCPECGVSIPHTHQPIDKYGTIIVDIQESALDAAQKGN